MASLSSLLSLLLILLGFLMVSTCRGKLPEQHAALFIFGDSLFDVGNSYYTANQTPDTFYLPYGETFLPIPTGRTSDGRLEPDFICLNENLTLIPPYLQGDTNYNDGANFASAGSGILNETGSDGAIGLNSQLGYFKTVVDKLTEQLGEEDTRKFIWKAVYLFSSGGDDIMSLYELESSLSPSEQREYMLMMLGNFTVVIEEIYSMGGRKFGIQNVGPMGCSPYTRSKQGKQTIPHCIEKVQALVTEYNSLLSERLDWLSTQLPNFKYSLFDYYTALLETTLHYQSFGFREGFSACCGSGLYNGLFTCANETAGFRVCANPSEYVWFDGGHPSERANMQLANLFWNGNHSFTWPTNLSTLFQMSSYIEAL